jgi:ADP-ribosylglycohydrolase
MPTQSLSRIEIVSQFGEVVDTLHDASPTHPYAAGLTAGTVTDDTEQSLALAHLLLRRNGQLEPGDVASVLDEWEESVRSRGLLDLLGPSTQRAITRFRSGVSIEECGLGGNTNGAAMRITPLAIATRPQPKVLADAVWRASVLTHNDADALGCAGMIAGFISASVEGVSWEEAVGIGLETAGRLVERAPNDAPDLYDVLSHAATEQESSDIDTWASTHHVDVVARHSVVTALATASAWRAHPWHAVSVAASLGDDTDTMAALVGALLGSRSGPDVFPAQIVSHVIRQNNLELADVSRRLLELRR